MKKTAVKYVEINLRIKKIVLLNLLLLMVTIYKKINDQNF